MKKDFMSYILKELDVKENEIFELKNEFGSWDKFYFAKNNLGYFNLKDTNSNNYFPNTLIALLNGRTELKKLPQISEEETKIREHLKGLGMKYLAKDLNGEVFTYSTIPNKRGTYWSEEDDLPSFNVTHLNLTLPNVDWDDSLQEI